MENTDILLKRNEYYSNTAIMFEIVKNLVGRETVFLSDEKCIRCIKSHKLNYLLKNANAFNFFRHPYNIYYSLARLYDMPMFNFNLVKRKIEQTEFNKSFDRYMVGYDLGLDFDTHQYNHATKTNIEFPFEQMRKDVKTLKSYFDKYNIAYELKCSGRGFHINVNSDKMPNFKDRDIFFKDMIERIKLILNLETLDKGSYDTRRIWKVPYSYDVKSGNVALPLNDEQFENFNFSIVKPINVLNNVSILGRGNLERNGTKQGFSDFISDFILDEGEEIGQISEK